MTTSTFSNLPIGKLTELARLFNKSGYSCYLVGGSVRNVLMGNPPTDLDLCTDALPDKIKQILSPWADHLWLQGEKFGTIGCQKDGYPIEVTTFRSERYELDSRKPNVRFGVSLEDDLSRRDFTMNAIALDLSTWRLVDRYDGQGDITRRTIRAVGTPSDRFREDPLRMLRAARFAGQFNFAIEQSTWLAALNEYRCLRLVSDERIRDELSKTLLSPHVVRALHNLRDMALLPIILPELVETMGVHQNPAHHRWDVYLHTLEAVGLAPIDLDIRLALLFHDVGKPSTQGIRNGQPTFYGHEKASAVLTRRRLRHLHYPNDLIERVTKLVGMHMRAVGTDDWGKPALRRFVRDAGSDLSDLLTVMECDRLAHSDECAERTMAELTRLHQRIDALGQVEEVQRFEAALDGDEIMELLGIGPGPDVGKVMRFLGELRVDEGDVGPDVARERLKSWWDAQSTLDISL